MKKRLISIILAASLWVSMFPVYANDIDAVTAGSNSETNEVSAIDTPSTQDAADDGFIGSDIDTLPAAGDDSLPENSDSEFDLELPDTSREVLEEIESTNDATDIPEIFTDPDPKYLFNFPFEGKVFANGTYYRTDVDYTIHNAWFDYDLTRVYNTQHSTTSSHAFPDKWRYSFEYCISTGRDSRRIVTLPNEKKYIFDRDSSNSASYHCSETYDTLTLNGVYYYYKKQGDTFKYKFNKDTGKLVAIVHESGAEIEVTYNNNKIHSLIDPTGNEYVFEYSGNRISAVSCEDANCYIAYTYYLQNGSYVLSAVDANGKMLSYEYNTSKNLTVVRTNGQILEEMEYNSRNSYDEYYYDGVHVITPEQSLKYHRNAYGIDRRYIYTYDYDNHILSTEDRVCNSYEEFVININAAGDVTDIVATDAATGQIAQYSYEYDSRHIVCRITDWYNGITEYTRDADGNITEITYPDGEIDSYTYNAEGKITSILSFDGRCVLYVYDTDNVSLLHRVEYLSPMRALPSFTYGVGVSDYTIKSYTYDAGSRLISSYTDERGYTTEYQRDDSGNITVVVLADSNEYTYEYNGQNRIISETTPMGLITEYEYDGAGNLLRTVFVPTGAITRYIYDSLGRIKQIISADLYDADLDGLNDSTPSNTYRDGNAGTRYIYSGYGTDSYSQYNPDGSVGGVGYVYFSGRHFYTKSNFTKPSDGDGYHQTNYSYDPIGRPTLISYDITFNNEVLYTYDSDDSVFWENAYYCIKEFRESSTVNDILIVSRYYNCHDQLIAEVYYDGTTQYYQYGMGGELSRFKDRNDRIYEVYITRTPTSIDYLTSTYDESYYDRKTYDYEGRLLQVRYYGIGYFELSADTYTYDSRGLLVSSDIGELHTEYEYDADGNCIGIYAVESVEMDYEYDPILHQTIVYESREVSPDDLYDDDTTTSVITTKVYDSVGNLIKVTDPNGNVTVNTYDEVGRLLTSALQIDEDILVVTDAYTYDGEGHVLTYTDGNGNTTLYEYDDRYNLIKTEDAMGNVTRCEYDAYGRKIREAAASNHISGEDISDEVHIKYEYDNDDRVIGVYYVTPRPNGQPTSALHRRYVYDGVGNIIREYDADNALVKKYSYNCANRLVSYITPYYENQLNASYVEHYTYDERGNVVLIDYANGGSKSYTYDANGNVLTAPFASYTYDDAGHLLTSSDANGDVTYTYNGFGKVATEHYGTDRWTYNRNNIIYQYDYAGNLISQTDSLGTTLFYTYDAFNRIVTLTISNEESDESFSYAWTYDTVGNVLTETDGLGYITSYTYDANNNMRSKTKGGCTTTYTYDAENRLLSTTDYNGVTSRYEYDAFGRVTLRHLTDGVYHETYTYDNNDRLVSSNDGFGTTTYQYNVDGDMISVTDPLHHVKTKRVLTEIGHGSNKYECIEDYTPYVIAENCHDQPVAIGFCTSASQIYHLNSDGVLTGNGANDIELYTYDNKGRIATRTDARGNNTSYRYTSRGKIGSVFYTDGTADIYQYRADGLVRNRYKACVDEYDNEDIIGNEIWYEYDILGRVTLDSASSETYDNTNEYTYDANGNVLIAAAYATDTDNEIGQIDHTRIRTYDALGRVLTDTQSNIGTFTYTYGEGYETMTHAKIGTVKKIYNSDGLLVEIDLDNSPIVTYTYINGKVATETRPNAAPITYTYNANSQVTDISSSEYRARYYIDERANIDYEEFTYLFDDGRYYSKGYGYDNRNRVIKENDYRDCFRKHYDYDIYGNLIRRSEADLFTDTEYTSTSYQYDSMNRNVNTTYDDSGNVIFEDGKEYNYDARNRLVRNPRALTRMQPNSFYAEYTYDTDNLRVSRRYQHFIETGWASDMEVWYYGYDKDNHLVLEYNPYDWSVMEEHVIVYYSDDAGNIFRMEDSGAERQLLRDGRGNVIIAKYPDGNSGYSYDVYEYSAYGENQVAGTIYNPIRYAGYYYDSDTGLYYLHNRHYNPRTTRFMSEDPYWNVDNMFGVYGDDVLSAIVQSGNRYGYCKNNPITFVDVLGLDAIIITANNAAGSSGLYFGHTSVIVQDENGQWNYYYWGSEAAYYVPVPDEYMGSLDDFNKWLTLDENKDKLKNSTKDYSTATYISGDFTETGKYYSKTVNAATISSERISIDFIPNIDVDIEINVNESYKLIANNCVTTSIEGLQKGVLESGKKYSEVCPDTTILPKTYRDIVKETFGNSSFTKVG